MIFVDIVLATAVIFLQLTSPISAGSCNVTAELDRLAVDIVQLYVSEDTDVLCLQNLVSPIGALAISSAREGLVVDYMRNSSVLILVPLTVWENFDRNITEWHIVDEQCWLQLRPIQGFQTEVHEIDIQDSLQLKAELCLNDTEQHLTRAITLLPEYFWYTHVHFDVLGIFYYTVDVTHVHSGRNISIQLWQRNSDPTVSNIRVSWMFAPLSGCAQSELTATIRSGCPSLKEFKFMYPEMQQGNEFFLLPVNYRPPSPLGSSLPTSPHIYHADPSQPLKNTHFKISQNAAFKQCLDKASRAECNCSESMEESQDIEFSDCIRKVYRHPYQETFQLEFTISLGEGREEEVTEPITVVEVNGRTSFEIKGLRNGSILPANNDSIRIVFKGPGLFHFQASVVTNASFCNLTTFFAVYVDRTPLLRATEYSIIVTSTVVFGAVVIFAYLLHHFTPYTSSTNNNK